MLVLLQASSTLQPSAAHISIMLLAMSTRTVPGHRLEARLFQHLAQRLRLRGGVFDVLDAVHPD